MEDRALAERIRSLSTEGLRSFKDRLRQRYAGASTDEQRSLQERFSSIPELQDIAGDYQAPTTSGTQTAKAPLWERALGVAGTIIGAPFQAIEENIITPAIAGARQGWDWATSGEDIRPREKGEGIKEWAAKTFEEWDTPTWRTGITLPTGNQLDIGVKNVLKEAPWALIPGVGQVGRAAAVGSKAARGFGAAGFLGRQAPKLGKLAPVIKTTAYAAEYSPWGLLDKGLIKTTGALAKPFRKKAVAVVPDSQGLLPALQPIEEAIGIATNPDALSKIGKMPYFRGMAKIIGGRAATADNPADFALLGRDILRFEGTNKALAATSTLTQLGSSLKVFNTDKYGKILAGSLKDTYIHQIQENPGKYAHLLTKAERVWLDADDALTIARRELLELYDIPIKDLSFEEGGRYAHRHLFGKLDTNDEILDVAYIGLGQPSRPGAKASFEKTRVFANIDDALAEGYRYFPPEEASLIATIGAYNRVADKQFTDFFLEKTPWRTTAGPAELRDQVQFFRSGVARDRVSLKGAHKTLRQTSKLADTAQGTAFEKVKYVEDIADDIWDIKNIKLGAAPRAARVSKTPTLINVERNLRSFKQRFKDIDAAAGSDNRFMEMLSTSTRQPLKKGETWRQRALNVVEYQQRIVREVEQEIAGGVIEQSPAVILKSNTDYIRGQLREAKKYANYLVNQYGKAATRNEKAYASVVRVGERLDGRLAELDRLQPMWHDALAAARRPAFGEVMASDIPGFAGKIFTGPEAKAQLNIIRKGLDPQFNSALHAVNQVNAVGRLFALGGDSSPFSIQLLFLAGSHPKIYGKAMGGFVRAFFDPKYQDNFIAKHIGTIQKNPGLILTIGGTTEMTEAMARGGLLRKQPLKLLGKVLPLDKFQRGFESALDTAGVYMAEAYEHLATSPLAREQVTSFINEFRGLLSTSRIGVSSTQRQLERATILAPQYTRAVGALVTDIFRGNLRGQLARDNMAKGTAAIMAMGVAVSLAMGDTEEEIVDHLNPTSSNFMTWDVAGQRVGPGSKVRSVMALFGKMVEKPQDAAYYAGQWLRGNASPVLSTGIDLITGKDFIGDPTRDGVLSLSKTVLGNNLLPIWVQSVAFDGGSLIGKTTRGVAEFGGLRTYPQSAYTELKDAQDKLSQETYGMTWDELGGSRDYGELYQIKLQNDNPQLKELSDKASEDSEKWARGIQVTWLNYNDRIQGINALTMTELEKASAYFKDTNDGNTFRERVNAAYQNRFIMRQSLLDEAQFLPIKESYATQQPNPNDSPQDTAYKEYNQMMYSEDMYDQYGQYKFDEAERRRTAFVARYGQDILDYVESKSGEKRADEPTEVKLLRQAQTILKDYWDIEGKVWSQLPPEMQTISKRYDILMRTDTRAAKRLLFANPIVVRARQQIAREKILYKRAHPEAQDALDVFY